MRLHILSDLHTEFLPFTPRVRDADVTILAGDLHTRPDALAPWAAAFDGAVVTVAGNHEYYDGHLQQRLATYRAAAAAEPSGRLHFLECDTVVIGGVRFLGATGWTDFRSAGDPEESMRMAVQCLADFHCIRADPTQTQTETETEASQPWMTPARMAALNRATRAWLTRQLDEPFDGPTVVVTHYAPALACIDTPVHRRRFKANPLDGYFANAWDRPGPAGEPALLGPKCRFARPPALWIYGHNHVAAQLQLGGTLTLTNPRGYPRERTGFDPGLVVAV